MKPYPLMMNIEGKRVLVVGGGDVALRKVLSLLDSGASVVVASPELKPGFDGLLKESAIEWLKGPFDESIFDQYTDFLLVFGATNRREVNVRIHRAATDRRIPCNIADVPDLCTFIVPAVINQGDLMIAVSTGGASPALARRIREELQERFGPEYAEMTRVMGELRRIVLQAGSSSDENRKLFLQIVNSDFLDALKDNDREKALAILRSILPEDMNPREAIEPSPLP